MKIISNYDELILSIESNDICRFEKVFSYSDCRNKLINKYIQNFGRDNLHKISDSLQAKALQNELNEICNGCMR